ncbi:PREDICTED: chitooligosaccharidolytic beta-N-acetylglucosaminidase [Polistes canadensis]|uniref:chitooligosaccharidolytic beta-N-acetylglucosaminidase n=1 Tax=Polistes canadensis TaxID=91411 RepID=UPI000718FEB4|nr:PREDICTED: chitooligosaccharidolytic beta-N-acetylglucosaminidase [Polistes canadensis]
MIAITFIFVLALEACSEFIVAEKVYNTPWHYKCNGGYCLKEEITEEISSPMSLKVCQLLCGDSGSLWPKPTGHLSLGNSILPLNVNDIRLNGIDLNTKVGDLLQENINILKENIKKLSTPVDNSGVGLIINVNDIHELNHVQLTLDTDESYKLQIYQIDDKSMDVTITAKTYFGARNALETLSQLIVFDDLSDKIQIIRSAHIEDKPAYPYRGILLDTSRNFISVEAIKNTIEAMSMSKMNTFHWHITDSHSFPYEIKTYPLFTKYGAYSKEKVYTKENIKDIMRFALLRGVRVLPEFDAPAHVGEGWQWVGHNTTVCFKSEPWANYCVEPPCGQLNPTSDKVYEILEGIYKEMLEDFNPDIFHMGGDEVHINCWNSSDMIKNWMLAKGWDLSESSFYLLWNYFQDKALDKLTLANGGKEIPVIIWTSGLTNIENIKYLDSQKYIVQIWTTGTDLTVGRLISNNFKVIISNYDALYLDCGFGAWVGEGNNWCSPYKGWQLIYDNSPSTILMKQGFGVNKKNFVLGGEVTLWTEQVDSTSVDSRLWPRSAAFAERLWSDPASTWIHAEHRILRHRQRLVQRGINADRLEPEWCIQNQGHCYSN